MTEPKDPSTFPGISIKQVPWWILPFLVGIAGGGAGGTVISRPVFASDRAMELTKDDVGVIVDDHIKSNNVYLLQQIDLLLTKDKLERATERKDEPHAP